MHVLDNPVWHALNGPHATVAEGNRFAARYRPDVSVFTALPDAPTPESWDALRDLIGPGGVAVFPCEIEPPAGWAARAIASCRQMWLPGALSPDTTAPADSAPPHTETVDPLTESDVPEMLALVERTRPGPFVKRTVELGTYLGVRDRERKDLVAMAGERIHPPGFTEISAVCTDADYRGRGLASRLVRALVHSIRNREETPFLHLTLENRPAHRVYSELGFETRRLVDFMVVTAPK
jgi:ribosomal protein S18 acetylase RimI-like enzyme